ncbi:MAG: glycosyltransferase family 1 protein [Firmicutes bacterium HGW-Firmicutes-7]|nr:MAG: glycosyltransferase family 1 protein [Firmicutes bacterium HGW-Firmicutes-7]
MEKVLFSASIDEHLLGFHIPYIKWFSQHDYEVHTASKGNKDIPFVNIKHNISFERSPFKIANIRAFLELKKLIDENEYKLIHCHTPMASIITRFAAMKARKKGTKVIYTAHGFHFFKGAPLVNWVFYYSIEKIASRYTDCLITINEEDYNLAKNKLFAKNIRFVNGVGIDLDIFKYQTIEKKAELRKNYRYDERDFILIYAGELSYRKHQDLLIDAINNAQNSILNIKLLLAGAGNLYDQYKEQIIKLGLEDKVILLGSRADVAELMMLSDIAVSASRQEGLPVNVMEAIAIGLPLIVTDCRGNRDLVKNNENGYVIGVNDTKDFSDAIVRLHDSLQERLEFSKKNKEIIQKYSLEKIVEDMCEIYQEFL